MGTICSLMHIDVSIKANQASRQEGIILTPQSPVPFPHVATSLFLSWAKSTDNSADAQQ